MNIDVFCLLSFLSFDSFGSFVMNYAYYTRASSPLCSYTELTVHRTYQQRKICMLAKEKKTKRGKRREKEREREIVHQRARLHDVAPAQRAVI